MKYQSIKCNTYSIRPQLVNSSLQIGDRAISLEKKEKTIKLFELLLQQPGKGVTKEEIMEYVFELPVDDFKKRNVRFRSSMLHNIIKLVSRARKLCELLAMELQLEDVEFCYHDRFSETWSFAVKHVPYTAGFTSLSRAG